MYNSVVCSMFVVKCSWAGLPEGRNCFCAWPFWCSELCSVDQTANSSKRECAGCEGSRVILPALLLTLDTYSSWRVGRVVPIIRSADRTILCSLLSSDLVAELNQTVIDGQIQWWRSRTVSAAPVTGWTSSAGKGSTTSAGPFSQWTQCDFPTSSPEKLWCPGIWMTPLQSQCCPWWWVGGVQGGFSWSPWSSPQFWACPGC